MYAYGVVASATLHRIQGPFPRADGYGEVTQSFPFAGGEAANSAIVLSRLGQRVTIDGTWVGATSGGISAVDILKRSGVDTSSLKILRKDAGLWEIVISDGPSRTVFGNYGMRMKSRIWNAPSKARMTQSRIICLDPALGQESILAGRMARTLNIPYVTLDCPYEAELCWEAAALIVSHDFLSWKYPKTGAASLFSRYRKRVRGLVVFTFGSGRIHYARAGGPEQTCYPYLVRPIDTTGAGDAFRAGIVFGLLKHWPDHQTIRYAAAVAAMVCTTAPAAVHGPRHADVLAFLRKHSC